MENDFAERIRKAAEEVSQSIDHEKQEKEREEAERTRRTEQAGQTLERLGRGSKVSKKRSVRCKNSRLLGMFRKSKENPDRLGRPIYTDAGI